jgi:chromosomal replication initiator protein
MDFFSSFCVIDPSKTSQDWVRQPDLIGRIQTEVARACNVSRAEMLSRSRRKEVAEARQIAMYLCRGLAGAAGPNGAGRWASFPRIGRAFLRDHTSVIHACRTVSVRRAADAGMARKLDQLTRELTADRVV